MHVPKHAASVREGEEEDLPLLLHDLCLHRFYGPLGREDVLQLLACAASKLLGISQPNTGATHAIGPPQRRATPALSARTADAPREHSPDEPSA
jgi:hypothetical protein